MKTGDLVTVWHRWHKLKDQGGRFVFNHLEDGHSLADRPADPFGRGWAAATWCKRHATMGPPGRYGVPVVL